MTVYSKSSMLATKAEIMKIPLVQESLCPEAKIAVPATAPPKRCRPCRYFGTMLFHFMNIALVVLMFVALGLVAYRQATRPATPWYHRYQGYCAVPIDLRLEDIQLMDQDMRKMPLHWTSGSDMQDENVSEEFVNVLREQLDINGVVEKISVYNNGHQVNFIHDFATNMTNIVDTERCFVMELNPDMVLLPEAFLLSIERGGEFDLTRVRSALRAVVPSLRDVASVPLECRTRPTYLLQREDSELNAPVRKRSADAPPHDFMHFSGKHVHEIQIGNMAELLSYEKSATA